VVEQHNCHADWRSGWHLPLFTLAFEHYYFVLCDD
jgi:hypothetical protein